MKANPVTFSLHCSLGCPGSVLAIAGPRTLAARGVRTQGGGPIQSSERGQTLATAGQDHSLPGLSQRPSDPLEVEEGIGPQTVCLSSYLRRGWHSSGGLFWTLLWALAESGPPNPGPISASKQHGSPKGDVTLLAGVPQFSKQLLASSVCVCRVKRHLHSVTVLSGKEPCLRQCMLHSPLMAPWSPHLSPKDSRGFQVASPLLAGSWKVFQKVSKAKGTQWAEPRKGLLVLRVVWRGPKKCVGKVRPEPALNFSSLGWGLLSTLQSYNPFTQSCIHPPRMQFPVIGHCCWCCGPEAPSCLLWSIPSPGWSGDEPAF